MMNTIFAYNDYRTYLADYLEAAKRMGTPLSYRALAQKAGLGSASTVMYVVQGRRNCSRDSALKLARALFESAEERQYFVNLVLYNQARTPVERQQWLKKLNATHHGTTIFTLEKKQYAFFKKWYHSVIRELITIHSITPQDHARLARLVSPPITPREAEASLRLQQELGYLCLDEQGIYRQTQALVATGVARDAAIEQFHLQLSEKAHEAFNRYPQQERSSSVTTLAVSEAMVEQIKEKLRATRQEILQMVHDDPNPERVYSLFVALFPTSRSKRGEDA
jgi:uncharacterized protein (TIGR02147 family)